MWKRNSTSQVNPRGSDGDGEGRGRGSASAPAEDAGEGMWTGVVSGRNWNGGAVAPGSPALSLARPCSCPVSALSVPLAGRRSQGRQAIAFRYNGKRDRSVETERGRAFALAGWVGERERELDVLSVASSDCLPPALPPCCKCPGPTTFLRVIITSSRICLVTGIFLISCHIKRNLTIL